MADNLIAILLISFAIQLVFYLIAATLKTDKFTDLAYGSTFVIITVYLINTNPQNLYTLAISSLIIVWGIRLSSYLFLRIINIGRDKRFDGIREKPLAFLQFWILQAASIVIIISPLSVIIHSPNTDPNILFYFLGLFIWICGFSIESIADYQKNIFKKSNPDLWVSVGLWSYSRHPNYFGEILVWVGVFISSSTLFTNNLQYMSVISPIFIATLLLFVSGIPPLEKHQMQKYGNNSKYLKYLSETNKLIPIPKHHA